MSGGPETRTVTIQRGDLRLAAVLLEPSGPAPHPCVVFVHGLGSGKDSPRNLVTAYALVDAGIAALLFDLSGHGESDADPRAGEEAYIEDLAAVFGWAAREPVIDRERMGIAGSSLGAVVALEAIRRGLVRPAALVLRAPPLDKGDLEGVGFPVLVIIGSQDPLLAGARAAVEGRDVALSVIEGAGHTFEEPGALEEAVRLTVEWFGRRLLFRTPSLEARGAGRIGGPT